MVGGLLRWGGLHAAGARRWLILIGIVCSLLLVVLTTTVDLRVGRSVTWIEQDIAIALAVVCCIGVAVGLLDAMRHLHRKGMLVSVARTTSKISAMAFTIVIAARIPRSRSAAWAATTWCTNS